MSKVNADVVRRGESFGEEFIVCPFCGHEDQDSWEWQPEHHGPEGDGEMDCGECERTFLVSRHVNVNYSTRKP